MAEKRNEQIERNKPDVEKSKNGSKQPNSTPSQSQRKGKELLLD